MSTTIQVQRETVQLLRKLKEEKDLTSYDEVILELIKESKNIGSSQMGKYPKLRPFKREKIERI
jgi:predicted CopG family antitoxin